MKKSRIVTFRGFGWEIAHEAVTRRPPVSLDMIVPRTGSYAYDVGFGICTSFKGHSLFFFCQTKYIVEYDSQLFSSLLATLLLINTSNASTVDH
jgi:hypothetical protein